MKVTDKIASVSYWVEFSPEEVDALVRAAEGHYDGECRGLAERGVLVTLKRMRAASVSVSVPLGRRDLDLLAKCVEMSPDSDGEVRNGIWAARAALCADQARVNDGL
jgi:hypothetical protein